MTTNSLIDEVRSNILWAHRIRNDKEDITDGDVDRLINAMTPLELLQQISEALDSIMAEKGA
jgi:hypothetical protein